MEGAQGTNLEMHVIFSSDREAGVEVYCKVEITFIGMIFVYFMYRVNFQVLIAFNINCVL